MSGISGISGNSYNYYASHIASGKRINSAADDASGSAIAEKEKSRIGAQTQAASNTQEGIKALNIADGAMSGITDYLDRIKELSVKASNGLMTDADKSAIQSEIDENLKAIDQIGSQATYNTKPLLDGSTMDIASSPDGTGVSIGGAVSTTEALGLKGYSVMGDFDMSRVDDAIDKVSSDRSSYGASTNALEYSYNYSQTAIENLNSANSRTEDLDMAQAISDMKKENVLQNYRFMMQKQQSDDENQVNRLLMGI